MIDSGVRKNTVENGMAHAYEFGLRVRFRDRDKGRVRDKG